MTEQIKLTINISEKESYLFEVPSVIEKKDFNWLLERLNTIHKLFARDPLLDAAAGKVRTASLSPRIAHHLIAKPVRHLADNRVAIIHLLRTYFDKTLSQEQKDEVYTSYQINRESMWANVARWKKVHRVEPSEVGLVAFTKHKGTGA